MPPLLWRYVWLSRRQKSCQLLQCSWEFSELVQMEKSLRTLGKHSGFLSEVRPVCVHTHRNGMLFQYEYICLLITL